MPAQKIQHQRIERLWLFPMRLMPRLANQVGLCIGQPCGDDLQHLRREQFVVFASDEKNRHACSGNRIERHLVGLSGRRQAGALRALLYLDPASRAFRVRLAINLGQFSLGRRWTLALR